MSTLHNEASTDRFLPHGTTPLFMAEMEAHKRTTNGRLRQVNLHRPDVQEILPCSLDAFESEIYLQGESKLQKEI